MKGHAALIYLVLLAAINACYCGTNSDNSDSDSEFQQATGCEGKPPDEPIRQRENVTVSVAHISINTQTSYDYKGSHWTETDSKAHAHLEPLPDHPVENRGLSKCTYFFKPGRVVVKCIPLSSEKPSDVTGNGRPQTEKPKITTTTPPSEPDDTVNSNRLSKDEGLQTTNLEGDRETHPFLSSPPDCGFSFTRRIIGGTQSIEGKWPWVVAYGFRDRRTKQEFLWMCGGSLVTQKHTITVAHCLTSDTHYIEVARIGDIYLNSTMSDPSAEERRVSRDYKIHPEYLKNPNSRVHDIAIVSVTKPFDTLHKPICLPFRRDMKDDLFVGRQAYVAGWGAISEVGFSSNVLMDVELPILNNQVCQDFYGPKRVNIVKDHICAGGEDGKDSCRGDSGGPLMIKNKNSYYLVGVVAFGASCGMKDVPGVYTRITSHMSWLEENLKS